LPAGRGRPSQPSPGRATGHHRPRRTSRRSDLRGRPGRGRAAYQ
jgi:hypothetical protein